MTQKKEACKLLTDNQVREVRSTHRKATQYTTHLLNKQIHKFKINK